MQAPDPARQHAVMDPAHRSDAMPFRLSGDDLATSIKGAVHIEVIGSGAIPRRLNPDMARRAHSQDLELTSAQAAGVTMELLTSASVLEIEAHLTRLTYNADTPPASEWVVETPDLYVAVGADPADGDLAVAQPDGTFETRPGGPSTVSVRIGTSSSARLVRVWLPHNAEVHVTAVRADALLTPAEAGTARPRWVHHGSSISHCTDIASPRDIWPSEVASDLGLDAINLGYAGNALLDPFTAACIRDLPADVITLKLGINVVNRDAFTARTFAPALHGFLDVIRIGHPATPIALITPMWCGLHEHTPGPTAQDAESGRFRAAASTAPDRLTLTKVRQLVRDVADLRGDSALHLVDGLSLLGPDDAHLLYDDLHPDEEGCALVGRRFAGYARDCDTALGRAFAPALASDRPLETN
ncbi:GDSL-type esterase/lipase family protein [Aeromicrobium sp. Root344]|uniref:GDSL-type esterase/lipase family protein n=1 Tax=Aeromicrobium sp. Root344 TaxID=1736521 RepID=UPI0012FA36E2|nr:GDSL-type esterase/lipase family protein [Aeromicrobium sp. Root344]